MRPVAALAGDPVRGHQTGRTGPNLSALEGVMISQARMKLFAFSAATPRPLRRGRGASRLVSPRQPAERHLALTKRAAKGNVFGLNLKPHVAQLAVAPACRRCSGFPARMWLSLRMPTVQVQGDDEGERARDSRRSGAGCLKLAPPGADAREQVD